MNPSKKTTLDRIAAASGVSLSTVDRVLNRRGGVSPAKEARVLEWANRLNVDRVLFRGYLRMLRVAVLMASPKNPFYRGLHDAFAELGTTMAEMRMTSVIYHLDPGNVRAAVKQLREGATACDALIVIGPNDPELAAALRQLSTTLPVVTLVTDIPGSGRIAYVGPDNRQMGRVAGELTGRFLGPQGGDVLLLLGMHHIIGHEEREMGFRSVIRERFPQLNISASLESGEDGNRAGEVIGHALRENSDIRGIYNVSSGNTRIARALMSMGLDQQVVLITHELTAERSRMLREGAIDAIIDQDPREEARRAVELLGRHFNRIEPATTTGSFTPFHIYLRENCPVDPDEKII